MELGTKVRDKITGFSGTITAKAEYIGGEVRLLVESKKEEGGIIEEWISESRVEAVV